MSSKYHFRSDFSTKNLYAFLYSSIRATWPANHSGLDFIIPIIFTEDWKSLRSYLAILTTLVLPCPSYTQASSSACYPRTPFPYWYILPLMPETKFRTSTKRRKLQFRRRSCFYIGHGKTKILTPKGTRHSFNSIFSLLHHTSNSDLLVWYLKFVTFLKVLLIIFVLWLS